ncbi:N-acetylmuramoyl-L-alanine amidase domain-containing protein SAOUHSC_02979-like [Clytia hemisphaerica]|uniref:N-acetylmuramoyl-L-alanine amidase domain-containing protein SAOUHSC_02979-like n=1 Tax=Clytia hemisphaerica TaxID=252671 RepID=UPI0034D58E58
MEEYNITQRKKQRSISLTSSAPSNIQSHEKDASTHIEGIFWFFDSTNTDQTDNNNQEEGMLSPPITNGKSSPFTKNQMDFINLLLNDQKEELTNEINKLKNELKTKDKQIFRLEKDLIDIQQYVRRNNIEIYGIPDTVEQKDLEKKVADDKSSHQAEDDTSNASTDHTSNHQADDKSSNQAEDDTSNSQGNDKLNATTDDTWNPQSDDTSNHQADDKSSHQAEDDTSNPYLNDKPNATTDDTWNTQSDDTSNHQAEDDTSNPHPNDKSNATTDDTWNSQSDDISNFDWFEDINENNVDTIFQKSDSEKMENELGLVAQEEDMYTPVNDSGFELLNSMAVIDTDNGNKYC